MLTREQAAEVFEKVRRLSSADEVEVLFSGGRSALTRFANNTIHQNVEESGTNVSVRPVFNGRTARASTNRFDEEGLRRVVQSAEKLARVQEAEPDLLPMTEAAKIADSALVAPSRHFAQTAALTPQDRALGVEKMVRLAERNKLTTAGIFSAAESCEGIFNSRGLAEWHAQTLAEVSITMLGDDSSGWQKLNSPDVCRLEPEQMAEVAAQKALQSVLPVELVPGKYTVVLEPSAVLDIVGFMFADFGGQAVLDQRSFLTGRVGAKLFGENITIWDDVAHPLQAGSPFDGEGVPRTRVEKTKKKN